MSRFIGIERLKWSPNMVQKRAIHYANGNTRAKVVTEYGAKNVQFIMLMEIHVLQIDFDL
jgi:hypothetical protein